jgi:hypothetical protein
MSVKDVRIIVYVRNIVKLIYGRQFQHCTETVDYGHLSICSGRHSEEQLSAWSRSGGNGRVAGLTLDGWNFSKALKPQDAPTCERAMRTESLPHSLCVTRAKLRIGPLVTPSLFTQSGQLGQCFLASLLKPLTEAFQSPLTLPCAHSLACGKRHRPPTFRGRRAGAQPPMIPASAIQHCSCAAGLAGGSGKCSAGFPWLH